MPNSLGIVTIKIYINIAMNTQYLVYSSPENISFRFRKTDSFQELTSRKFLCEFAWVCALKEWDMPSNLPEILRDVCSSKSEFVIFLRRKSRKSGLGNALTQITLTFEDRNYACLDVFV